MSENLRSSTAMRKKAKYEYVLSCSDCGETISSASDKSFLTPKNQRWKNHVAKDCMNGDYQS